MEDRPNLSRILKALRLTAVVALSFFSAACGDLRGDEVGTYESVGRDVAVELELKEDGQGHWSTVDEDLEFTWERRADDIWMHTKAGGVFVGTLQDDGSISVELPAAGTIEFKRSTP